MGRLLDLLLFAFFAWLAWEGLKSRIRAFFAAEPPPRPPVGPKPPPAQTPETLVRCAACGTYVLASRALPGQGGGGDLYCSDRCRAGRG